MEVNNGQRGGVTTEMAEMAEMMMKALERENRELKQANEILRSASAYFAPTLIVCPANDCRAAGRSSTVPAGPGEPPIPRACAKCALGVGFYLRVDMAGDLPPETSLNLM